MGKDIIVKKEIGQLSDCKDGWTLELNIVSVDNGDCQYDLREWSLDHTAFREGVSFNNEEATALLALLKECFKNSGEAINIESLPEYKRNNSKDKDMNMSSPNNTEDEELYNYLNGENIDFSDKRAKGGALWIVGGHELDNIMDTCKKMGYKFLYSEKGGKVTKNQPGWYLRAK